MRTVHIFVQGRVQAVGFRYYTLTQAQSIGVKGWVKNRNDGRVEIIAQGGEEPVESFIQSVKKGPRFSHVEDMKVEDLDNSTEYRSFEITY